MAACASTTFIEAGVGYSVFPPPPCVHRWTQSGILPQPKENVWVTLANVTGQNSLSLSTATPNNPFSMCLIGVPLSSKEFKGLSTTAVRVTINSMDWNAWFSRIGHSPSLPPQELQTLGSMNADWCTYFRYTKKEGESWWVNATLPGYSNVSRWCNTTSKTVTMSFSTHMSLPSGLFLICGDRAWPSKVDPVPWADSPC